MDIFFSFLFSAPTFCRTWNTQLVEAGYNVHIVPVATFFMIFGSRMNILFIVKDLKIVWDTKWMFSSLQLCELVCLKWLTNLEHVLQSLLNTCLWVFDLRFAPNHTPIQFKCLFTNRNQMRNIYLHYDEAWFEGGFTLGAYGQRNAKIKRSYRLRAKLGLTEFYPNVFTRNDKLVF